MCATGLAAAVNGNDKAGGQLEETVGQAAEELDFRIVSAKQDGPVSDELVQDVHDCCLVGESLHRPGQHEEDCPVERAENPLKGEDRGATAPLGLLDQLEYELEHLVGVLLEDSLPQLVHQAGGQIEDIWGNVIGRTT